MVPGISTLDTDEDVDKVAVIIMHYKYINKIFIPFHLKKKLFVPKKACRRDTLMQKAVEQFDFSQREKKEKDEADIYAESWAFSY